MTDMTYGFRVLIGIALVAGTLAMAGCDSDKVTKTSTTTQESTTTAAPTPAPTTSTTTTTNTTTHDSSQP